MDSPVARLLYTNCIPTDHQAQYLKPIISQSENEISLLDNQIATTQATLNNQLRDRSRLREHLEAHKALLSPARRLPNDIITEIFLRCLPAGRYPGFSAQEAPLLLTSICHGWRELALSTPRLWRAFQIHISPIRMTQTWRRKGLVSYRPQINGVETWLMRSRGCPLSISLFSRGQQKEFESAMLNVLIQHAHRWKDIHLKINSTVFSILTSLTGQAVPLLQRVSLDVSAFEWGDSGRSSLNWGCLAFLETAPLLQRVSFFTVFGEGHVLPWTQLTHLCMTTSNGMAMKILRCCSQLKNCRFDIVESLSTPELTSQHTMPLLESLHLRSADSGASIASMLEHLDLPKLYEFSIESRYIPGAWNHGPLTGTAYHIPQWCILITFLSRVVTPLKRLSLLNIHLSEDNLIECLKLNPGLVELSYRDSQVLLQPSPIAQKLLELLSLPRSSHSSTGSSASTVTPVLAPALESITLRAHCAVTDAAIFDFCQSRWNPQLPGVAQLKSATFQFEKDNPDEEFRAAVEAEPREDREGKGTEEPESHHSWDAMRDLAKQGLDILVISGAHDVLDGRHHWFNKLQWLNNSWWLPEELQDWVLNQR